MGKMTEVNMVNDTCERDKKQSLVVIFADIDGMKRIGTDEFRWKCQCTHVNNRPIRIAEASLLKKAELYSKI